MHEIVSHNWTGPASLQALSDKKPVTRAGLFSASGRVEGGGVQVLLELANSGTIRAGQVFVLEVPAKLGLVIPPGGFGPAHNFTISVDAAAAQTRALAFAAAPSIGHFSQTSISFVPAGRAGVFEGEVVVLRMAFSLNAEILAGETVDLYLPGFSKVTGHTCSSSRGNRLRDIVADMASLRNVTWPNGTDASFNTIDPIFHKFKTATWDPDRSRLTLTASAHVLDHEHHTVTVPCEAGMVLTKAGLSPNDPRLRIGTSAVSGRVAGEQIEISPGTAAVCGLECGGIFAQRLAALAGDRAHDSGQASEGRPVLPSSCRSPTELLEGACTCECESSKAAAADCAPCVHADY